jgi:tetratricopeptide (TPR) repeat protein
VQPTGNAERGAQWRQLANAEAGLGRLDAALSAAEQARRYAPANLNGALSLMAWGEAVSRKGRHADAIQAIAEARAGAEKSGVGADSLAMLRMRRAAGEALLRQGTAAEAARVLAELVEAHRALRHQHRGEWALVLDALACAQHLAGSADAAATRAASAERHAAAYGPDHPLRLRHEALGSTLGVGPPDALSRWMATLAIDSPWRQQRPANCAALI